MGFLEGMKVSFYCRVRGWERGNAPAGIAKTNAFWRPSGLGYNTGMSDSAESVAHAFVRAINRQDVAGLVALMAPEHRFVDSLGSIVEGPEKMRAGWAGYFRMVPDYSIAVEEIYCDGPVALMLGVAEGTYAPAGKLKVENRWKTPVALRAQVENGLVAEWRVYGDNEPLRERMRTHAAE
jgi:ketosteroid isomerase-like protein